MVIVGLVLLVSSLAAPGANAAEGFTQELASIQAGDDKGPFDQPWTGGFLAPQPQLTDLDEDGDVDVLLLQEGTGIQVLRNVGDPRMPRFELEVDALAGILALSWFRLADIDADGDLDIFTGGSGPLRFYRNVGSTGSGPWELADAAFGGIVNLGIFNTPAFADIDADGDLDYLEMEQTFGTARLYRNQGTPQVPDFVHETDSFGCIDTFDAGKQLRHGISALTVGDVDGDGDPDIFVGDVVNPNLWFFRNDPGPTPCFTRVTHDFLPLTTLGFNQVALADLDADEDLDIVLGARKLEETGANLFLLQNVGSGQSPAYQLAAAPLIRSIDVGRNAHPAVVDLDADGDLDLVVGAEDGGLHVLRNVGSSTQPFYQREGLLVDDAQQPIDAGSTAAPAFIDTDADGDPDLFLGQRDGTVAFYRNLGDAAGARFYREDSAVAGLDADFQAAPAAGDLDGDGDVDLLVGEFGITENPALWWLRNEGSPGSPSWRIEGSNLAPDVRFAPGDFSGELTPQLLDLEGDGDLDLLLGEVEGNVNLFRNEGTSAAFDFVLETESYASAQTGRAAVPCAFDIDGDGDLDLVVGTRRGGLQLYRFGPLDPSPDGSTGVLVTVHPNPFRAATTLSFQMPRAGVVHLQVYDARGRRVATLANRTVDAGPIDATWSGQDDRGQPLAAGVFFYELLVSGSRERGKLVRLK